MSLQDSRQLENVKVLLKVGADGRGIAEIEKVGTSGVVDTYDIILSDGTRIPFDVTNGSSIATIEKTATVGLVDTYTITLTNGDTFEFTVTNADGSTAETVGYDNTNSGLDATNVQDAIDEVNDKADANTTTLGTKANMSDLTNINEIGATATQTISSGTYFYLNEVLVRAKTDIASGATFTLNTNYEVVPNGGLNEIPRKVVQASVNTTVGANSVHDVNMGTVPTGYTLIGGEWSRGGGGTVFIVSFYNYNNEVHASIYNAYTSPLTFLANVNAYFAKTTTISQ